tara:strand:- start:120 stop:1115 length:996 start_codon:yes stop_codon:yes gene_type:complete
MSNNILISGGAGFIGSHLIRFLINNYKDYKIYNFDMLTYAGNLKNLSDIENHHNYNFLKIDISDFEYVRDIFKKYKIEKVIHLAAESHVDKSITHPLRFAKTNVLGTLSLLEAARHYWKNDYTNKLFYHISTDEVYGSAEKNCLFNENSKYHPNSPYSASKASSDHFVMAYGTTYNFPVVISNSSNNYGPNQYAEKLIPLFINNIIKNKPLPLYGSGQNIRDWIFVTDHVRAIDKIFHQGKLGETYNIGGDNLLSNFDLTKKIINITDKLMGKPIGSSKKLIKFVEDRPGHDFRYAVDSSKIKNELGWKPKTGMKEGLKKTVKWYLDNKSY